MRVSVWLDFEGGTPEEQEREVDALCLFLIERGHVLTSCEKQEERPE